MFYEQTTFIGIDPTAGQRPFVYVALDHDLHLLAIGQGQMQDTLAFAAGQRQAIVGVCAPRRPNCGVMAREEVRQSLSPSPRPGRWEDFRLAEYQLRQHNISAPQTRAVEAANPNWMRTGFEFFRRLEHLGYQPYPTEDSTLQSLEVYPHATFAVFLGQNPFPKHSLEGRLQRQLAMYERKVRVSDPMRLFEEITRYKLLSGILPEDILLSPEELDALAAAYTAWLVANHPEEVSLLGAPEEGQIVLPAATLKAQY